MTRANIGAAGKTAHLRAGLPVACTLDLVDGAQRLEQWRQITSVAGAGRKFRPGKLTLTFRDRPTVRTELERLVAAERDCCRFLGWNLTQVGAEWHVEITGSDDELRALVLAE